MSPIEKRLAHLGLTLPQAAAPVAAYVPVMVLGNIAHVSGQLPLIDNKIVTGRLGQNLNLEQGVQAAQACALMILAQLSLALGSLERVERIVKLGGFVNSAEGFVDQPKVVNGASDLMLAIFGDCGRHARSAVGVPILPLGASVEIDAIVAIKP